MAFVASVSLDPVSLATAPGYLEAALRAAKSSIEDDMNAKGYYLDEGVMPTLTIDVSYEGKRKTNGEKP